MNNITQPILPGLQPHGSGPIILTSDGVAVSNLSPQEALFYPSLFRLALGPKAIQTDTTIPATKAAAFLKRSGLNKKQLHDIWMLSDPSDLGYLTSEGFFKACRLVGHAQCGSSIISPDLLCQEPASLPFFEGSENGVDGVWNVSELELQTFSDVYRKEGGSTKLDGTDARSLLQKSGLSNSELCDIWDLADTDKDGKLTFGEFVVAMAIVSRVREGKAFIPPSIPAPLQQFLNMQAPDPGSPSKTVTFAISASEKPPTVNLGFDSDKPTTSPVLDTRPVSPKAAPARSEPVLLEHAMEKRELDQSILRTRQIRKQVMEGRERLLSLKEDAKKVEIELISADHDVEKLQDQILSLQQQITEVEDDLDTFRREAGVSVLPEANGDVLAAVAKVREAVVQDEQEVLELRAQLERVQREKDDLNSTLAVLQEKKRQADQDRNLMIAGLENERAKLIAVRAERLKLWEHRHQLTRELTSATFDQLNASMKQFPSSGVLPSAAAVLSPSRPGQVRDKKGVKADSVITSSPPQDARGWSQFGTGEPFKDPVAGAFSTQAAPMPSFGSNV